MVQETSESCVFQSREAQAKRKMTSEESKAVDEYLSKYDPTGVTYLGLPLREFTHEQLCKAMVDMAERLRAEYECTAMEKRFQKKLRSLRP